MIEHDSARSLECAELEAQHKQGVAVGRASWRRFAGLESLLQSLNVFHPFWEAVLCGRTESRALSPGQKGLGRRKSPSLKWRSAPQPAHVHLTWAAVYNDDDYDDVGAPSSAATSSHWIWP